MPGSEPLHGDLHPLHAAAQIGGVGLMQAKMTQPTRRAEAGG